MDGNDLGNPVTPATDAGQASAQEPSSEPDASAPTEPAATADPTTADLTTEAPGDATSEPTPPAKRKGGAPLKNVNALRTGARSGRRLVNVSLGIKSIDDRRNEYVRRLEAELIARHGDPLPFDVANALADAGHLEGIILLAEWQRQKGVGKLTFEQLDKLRVTIDQSLERKQTLVDKWLPPPTPGLPINGMELLETCNKDPRFHAMQRQRLADLTARFGPPRTPKAIRAEILELIATLKERQGEEGIEVQYVENFWENNAHDLARAKVDPIAAEAVETAIASYEGRPKATEQERCEQSQERLEKLARTLGVDDDPEASDPREAWKRPAQATAEAIKRGSPHAARMLAYLRSRQADGDDVPFTAEELEEIAASLPVKIIEDKSDAGSD